jgi:hypothetical protein
MIKLNMFKEVKARNTNMIADQETIKVTSRYK